MVEVSLLGKTVVYESNNRWIGMAAIPKKQRTQKYISET